MTDVLLPLFLFLIIFKSILKKSFFLLRNLYNFLHLQIFRHFEFTVFYTTFFHLFGILFVEMKDMENITFSTTASKMDWLSRVAGKSHRSVDFVINMLIDGYLEDIEQGYESSILDGSLERKGA